MNIIMGAPKGATGEMGGERWRERCGICKARRSHLPCTHSKAKDKRPARRSRVDSRGRKSWCALVLFRVHDGASRALRADRVWTLVFV